MKYGFFLLLFSLWAGTLPAQTTDRAGTEVLDAIRGEPLLELKADLELYSYAPEDGWYRVRREVYVDPAAVRDSQYLAEGTELRNQEGESLGRCLREVKVAEGAYTRPYRGKQRFRAIVEGYLFKTKLKDGSAPEAKVEKILALKNRTDQQEAWRELFDRYAFEERQFDEFTVRVFREQQKTLQEEKDFRLILIFRDGSTPYAVITNDHDNLEVPRSKMETKQGPFRIQYFYKPPSRQQELIEDRILYTYLAL